MPASAAEGFEAAGSPPAALTLAGVACTFVSKDAPGQRYTAVQDVDLRVGAGEFVSVVGPTGCGKSTLLNVGAGLLQPSTGSVQVFGQPLQGINARAGYMFQSESLMPWRTAATSEWVVPRSMPTATRRWCGSRDCPGSEICRSDMNFCAF